MKIWLSRDKGSLAVFAWPEEPSETEGIFDTKGIKRVCLGAIPDIPEGTCICLTDEQPSLEVDEDTQVPECGTPAYELFDRAIHWTIDQLQKVLGVKEWSTSGGGTETLEGDVQSELYDLLKAAGRDDDSMERLKSPQPITVDQAVERLAEEAKRLPDGHRVMVQFTPNGTQVDLARSNSQDGWCGAMSFSEAIGLAKPKVPELWAYHNCGDGFSVYSMIDGDCTCPRALHLPANYFPSVEYGHRVRIAWDEAGIRMVGDVQKIGW